MAKSRCEKLRTYLRGPGTTAPCWPRRLRSCNDEQEPLCPGGGRGAAGLPLAFSLRRWPDFPGRSERAHSHDELSGATQRCVFVCTGQGGLCWSIGGLG